MLRCTIKGGGLGTVMIEQINELDAILEVPKAKPPADVLAYAFLRLTQEGLRDVVFYDQPGITVVEYLVWCASINVLGCYIRRPLVDSPPVLVGLGFINKLTEINGYRRGEVGMFFFREYWGRKLTQEFCEKMLDWCFQDANLDAVYGISPVNNRLAVAFSRRMGFHQVGPIPKFCTWKGKPADGMISVMTREEWY